MRILVVDDERPLRDVLRRALMLAGYDVRLAEDGLEGLAEVNGSAPDAVVLDIGMPGIDGYEVARRLRAAGHKFRIIAVTGWGQEADRQKAQEAGFDVHLVKPVLPDRLIRELEGEIRGNRPELLSAPL